MASQRNRILEVTSYLENLGIEVNIGKNKARGNKGFFKSDGKTFRIDVAKNLSEEAVLKVLIHEFAHFLHYRYDKTLNSLEFIINNINDDLTEEMIRLTVDSIPKESVAHLFDAKDTVKSEIKTISKKLSISYPDFKPSQAIGAIEKEIKKSNLKYLLKYDKVKVIEGFACKTYSIEEIDCEDKNIEYYLKLKSLQRKLKRINSRINRLNKYYNSPSELFARSLETYLTDRELFLKNAPMLVLHYDNAIKSNKIPYLSNLSQILLYKC